MGTQKDTAPPRDWRTGVGYPPVKGTSTKRWAWEFLRRNPNYHTQWEQLRQLTLEIEPRYEELRARYSGGELSSKEWHAVVERLCRDERYRHYEPPRRSDESKEAWIGRVRRGRSITVPAHLGAFWGLESFADPDQEYSDSEVIFLESRGVTVVNWDWRQWEEKWGSSRTPVSREAVLLDFEQPLAAQIDAIRGYWSDHREWLIKENLIQPWPDKRNRRGAEELCAALRALDAREAGVKTKEISDVLFRDVRNDFPGRKREKTAATLIETAERLRDSDWRFLIWPRE